MDTMFYGLIQFWSLFVRKNRPTAFVIFWVHAFGEQAFFSSLSWSLEKLWIDFWRLHWVKWHKFDLLDLKWIVVFSLNYIGYFTHFNISHSFKQISLPIWLVYIIDLADLSASFPFLCQMTSHKWTAASAVNFAFVKLSIWFGRPATNGCWRIELFV